MNIYRVSVACHRYKHVIHAFIFVLTLIVFIYSFPCRALCLRVPNMLHHSDRDAGESQHEPCQCDLHTHTHTCHTNQSILCCLVLVSRPLSQQTGEVSVEKLN